MTKHLFRTVPDGEKFSLSIHFPPHFVKQNVNKVAARGGVEISFKFNALDLHTGHLLIFPENRVVYTK